MHPIEIGLDWHRRHGHAYFAAFVSSRPHRLTGIHNWIHVTHAHRPCTREDLSAFRLGDDLLSDVAWVRALSRVFASGRTVTSITCHTDIPDGAARRSIAMRFTGGFGVQTLQLGHDASGRTTPMPGGDARNVVAAAAPAIALAAETITMQGGCGEPVASLHV